MNSGITSGAKKNQDWPENGSSDWPPTAIVDAASSSPSMSAPLSPMKMLAGLKLNGRNPMHTPAVTTAINGPTLDGSSTPTSRSRQP